VKSLNFKFKRRKETWKGAKLEFTLIPLGVMGLGSILSGPSQPRSSMGSHFGLGFLDMGSSSR